MKRRNSSNVLVFEKDSLHRQFLPGFGKQIPAVSCHIQLSELEKSSRIFMKLQKYLKSDTCY